jgi:hypothetical protein
MIYMHHEWHTIGVGLRLGVKLHNVPAHGCASLVPPSAVAIHLKAVAAIWLASSPIRGRNDLTVKRTIGDPLPLATITLVGTKPIGIGWTDKSLDKVVLGFAGHSDKVATDAVVAQALSSLISFVPVKMGGYHLVVVAVERWCY